MIVALGWRRSSDRACILTQDGLELGDRVVAYCKHGRLVWAAIRRARRVN